MKSKKRFPILWKTERIDKRLAADEYIDFLKHTDLGSQYPKERFEERIGTLVNKASISLVARNETHEIIGVCF